VLLDHYWGRYVAFIRNKESGEVHVLRDPTGTLPCFITVHEGVSIVFSDIESCLALGLLHFSVNWKYIAAFVPYPGLQIRDTGLNEVTEVQPGECVTFRAEHTERRMLWSPLDAPRRGLIEDPAAAIVAVRDRVRACVQAWLAGHHSILHNLSGGLDSSIVLSCLRSAPSHPQVTCVHYFAPATGEDERKYARIAAEHCRAELVECPLDPNALELKRLLQIRRSPRPWSYLYDLEQGALETAFAKRYAATAVFSGASGDGLFVQGRAELAVADYLCRHGFGPGVLGVSLDAARMARTSMWQILHRGVRQHLNRRAPDIFAGVEGTRSLIAPEASAAARNNNYLVHPWLAEADGIPSGLRWHILCLSIPPAFYNSFEMEGEVERTPVLFSQPLIELCLRIPTYVWISGGRDRAIARHAFAADLPASIIRRTQKGAIDRHNRKLVDANGAFLREMLLDGQLVSHGLLDRERLESVLTRGSAAMSFEYNEVLRQHLCTEVWLRRWSAITSSSSH
jgi:asparagine synthase (glutamine-hydrolysing)